MQIKAGDQILVSGFVPKDAEYRTVGEKQTPLCKFSVKAGEREEGGQKIPIWRNVTCWRDLAAAARNVQKGDIVLVCGVWRTYTYEGREGPMEGTEIVCDFLQVMGRGGMVAPKPTGDRVSVEFEELPELPDDLPF